jgi:L-asparaginase/Glu-tRNA(Gln) amidotransferase subunit D
MVQNPPVPIVMVGSQRSSDRPSSDAAINLINAVKAAAEGDIAEVQVCMFGPTSDEYCLLHRGTRVRKMHSSYRSTFRTIGDVPLAMIDRDADHATCARLQAAAAAIATSRSTRPSKRRSRSSTTTPTCSRTWSMRSWRRAIAASSSRAPAWGT